MQNIMICPKCKTSPLKSTMIRVSDPCPDGPLQCRVDYCPQCRGIWFDRKELETVCPAACKDLRVPADAPETTAFCPRCDARPLYVFQYPQTFVQIEMCRKCKGIWLDAGEYKEIRVVRTAREKNGQLRGQDPPSGTRGLLINLIERSIEHLYSELFS